jgi:hypothetical protein
MKKLPRPHVIVNDATDPAVVRLEWDFFAIELYEDEALLLARSIHDALEVPS